jgi:hypothetical protein
MDTCSGLFFFFGIGVVTLHSYIFDLLLDKNITNIAVGIKDIHNTK